MYNLLMAGAYGYWDQREVCDFEWSRFLEHTTEGIKSKLLPVSDSAVRDLIGYPSLFSYEFDSTAPHPPYIAIFARVGRIVEIQRRQTGLALRYEFDADVGPIPLAKIVELAWDLDINIRGLENYRTHWAVKDVDLFAVLRKNGFLMETNPVDPEVAAQLRTLKAAAPRPSAAKPKVFIVHGRDDGIKNEVGRWIARIGLDDIILHEQPNLGRTIISKFHTVAADVAFAVVIMTPDDVGGLAGGAQANRARQNVIFELGFFIAKLGQEKVAALLVGEIEKPSDYEGVVYIEYDKRGAWKLDLAREFVALNIPFDPAKAL